MVRGKRSALIDAARVTILYLAVCFAAHAFGQPVGIGAMGDSLTDEYDIFTPWAYQGEGQSWVELLGSMRSSEMDFGAYSAASLGAPRYAGYAYNWARSGATTATLLSEGQHSGLAQQIVNGNVSLVCIAIGTNDFSTVQLGTVNLPGFGPFTVELTNEYGPIYNGQRTDQQVSDRVNAFVNNFTMALDAVSSAGARVVVATAVDRGSMPADRNAYPDAARRQRVTNAVKAANAQVTDIALSRGMPVIDFAALVDLYHSSTPVLVGGINSKLPGSRYFLGDGVHPSALIQGLFANAFIDAANGVYGTSFTPLSATEILMSAGITPPVSLGETFDVSTLLSLPPAILSGDFNDDGTVDAADYVVWRKGLGTFHTQNDYDVWRAHFGVASNASAAVNAGVPEARAIVLFMCGLCAFGRLACRGCRHALGKPTLLARCERAQLKRSSPILLLVVFAGTYESIAATPNGYFTNPRPLMGANINSPTLDGNPVLSADGLSLYFTSDRPLGGGIADIFRATRASVAEPFASVERLVGEVNSPFQEIPSFVATGDNGTTTLWFTSDRPGGFGGRDLYTATMPPGAGTFANIQNMGAGINTASDDRTAFPSQDGISFYFYSDRPGTLGEFDIYKATRPSMSEPYGVPVRLAEPVNSAGWDGGNLSFSSDELTLFFYSNRTRPGDVFALDVWVASRESVNSEFDTAVDLNEYSLGSNLNTIGDVEATPHVTRDWPASGSKLYYLKIPQLGNPGFANWDIWEATWVQVNLGDFNTDGTVDAADYVVWRKGLGTFHTQNDYDVWRAHFGVTSGAGRANAAPEPATWVLVTALIMMALRSRDW